MIEIGRGIPWSDEADPSRFERNPGQVCAPFLSCGHWKGAGERSRRYDFAWRERRTVRILSKRLGEMAKREQGSVEDVGRGAVIDVGSVTEQINLEAREL